MRIHEFLRARGKSYLRAAGGLLCIWMAFNSPIASANFTYFAADCATGVTFTYAQFPLSPVQSHEIIKVDGVVVYDGSYTVNKTVPGSTITHTVPFSPKPSTGPHTVVASTNYTTDGFNKTTTSSPLAITCACTPGTDNAAGAHATGDAFGLSASLPVLGAIAEQPKSQSSQAGVGESHGDKNLATIKLPPATGTVVALGLLNTSSTGTITASQARDNGYSEVTNVNLLGGIIKATAVRASVEAIATGNSASHSTAGSTFEGLTINGTTYNDVAPNTKITLPPVAGLIGTGSFVVLREESSFISVPGDNTLSGGTYEADARVNMIRVVVKLAGTRTEITVAHAGANADFPQTSICSLADRNSVSGHAFVASVDVGSPVNLPVVVGLSEIPSTGGSASQNLAAVNVPGTGSPLLTGGSASSSSTGTVGATSTAASSTAAIQNANLLNGVVTATVIQTQANSAGSSAGTSSDDVGTQLVGIRVAGIPIANNPAPNKTYTLPGIGYVIFNEHLDESVFPNHTGLTVRAIHLVVTSPLPGLVPGAEIIVSESHSDTTFIH